MRKLDSHLFKGSKDNQGILAWSHGVGEKALVESLYGRYGIWVVPLLKTSPGFRLGMGSVEDASINLRHSRGLQELIRSTMRVNLMIGILFWQLGVRGCL